MGNATSWRDGIPQCFHHLIYFSRNSVGGDDRAHINHLRDILSASQRNNRRQGITGYLIYDKHWFLQVLKASAPASSKRSSDWHTILGTGD